MNKLRVLCVLPSIQRVLRFSIQDRSQARLSVWNGKALGECATTEQLERREHHIESNIINRRVKGAAGYCDKHPAKMDEARTVKHLLREMVKKVELMLGSYPDNEEGAKLFQSRVEFDGQVMSIQEKLDSQLKKQVAAKQAVTTKRKNAAN